MLYFSSTCTDPDAWKFTSTQHTLIKDLSRDTASNFAVPLIIAINFDIKRCYNVIHLSLKAIFKVLLKM